MFVQVIQGQVDDAAKVRAAMDRWAEELAPGLGLALHDVPFTVPFEAFWTSLMWHERTHADPASRHFRQALFDALRSPAPAQSRSGAPSGK